MNKDYLDKKIPEGAGEPDFHDSDMARKSELLFWVWKTMKQRCRNKNNKKYKDYGKRGITVCEEWESSKPFITWAMNNGYETGLYLDRIDNDGDYSPENCRFVISLESVRNQRLLKRNNTSGYRGVSYMKRNKKWRARVGIKGDLVHIGTYNNKIDAAVNYDSYVISHDLGLPINFPKQSNDWHNSEYQRDTEEMHRLDAEWQEVYKKTREYLRILTEEKK